MKCEWCSSNLPDEGLVCAHCGHDNAISLDGEIVSSAQLRPTAPLKPEATLIPFPNSVATASEKSARTSDEVPAWRDQIRESVRLYREQQRSVVAETLVEEVVEPELEPEEAPPAIVEAALKRLRRPVSTIAEATSRQALKSRPAQEPVVTERFNDGPLFSSAKLITHPKPEQSPAPATSSERSSQAAPIRLSSETISARHEPGLPAVAAVNPHAQPARLADRALASIFDLAVIIAASVPLFAIHSITQIDTGHGIAYIALAIVIWVCFIYQIWTLLVARRTCGMAWRNLKIVDAETHELTFPEWRMFARSLAATVGLLVPPLNLLVIWSSGSQASLADLLSRTRVCSFSKTAILNPPAKS